MKGFKRALAMAACGLALSSAAHLRQIERMMLSPGVDGAGGLEDDDTLPVRRRQQLPRCRMIYSTLVALPHSPESRTLP